MHIYNVRCPLCSGSQTRIEIPDSWAIFRVEGYSSDPERKWDYLEPDPDRVYGVRNFIDQKEQKRLEATCQNGHHLRVYTANYEVLGEDDALYGPGKTPVVTCIHCGYNFGEHNTFNRRETTDPENHLILRSVSRIAQTGHKEVETLSRKACLQYDQISRQKECPNCGKSVFFNYRSRKFDADLKFLGHQEQQDEV